MTPRRCGSGGVESLAHCKQLAVRECTDRLMDLLMGQPQRAGNADDVDAAGSVVVGSDRPNKDGSVL